MHTPEPEKLPLLERLGVRYLRWRAASAPALDAEDAIHVLNPREQAKLRRVERGVVLRAGIAGALSALASALAERWADATFGAAPDGFELGYYASYWGVVGGVTALATLFEILFLYRDSLEGTHRLSHAAGLTLDGVGKRTVASALARAALELPNPLETPYRLDPHREVSKPRLLVATLLYKLKVGLTSFLLKLILRRLFSRAALRLWLVFVSVPVTAAWNAVVAFRVIREARVRVIGPSAARELTARLFERCPAPSPEGAVAALRAVGACVVSSFDLHPNHLALLEEVRERLGGVDLDEVDLGDRPAFVRDLALLRDDERRLAIGLLGVAAVLDGRLTRRERALFASVRAGVGLTASTAPLSELRRAFVAGRPIDDALLDSLGGAR